MTDDDVALVGFAVLVAPASRPSTGSRNRSASGTAISPARALPRHARAWRSPSRSSPAGSRPGPPGRGAWCGSICCVALVAHAVGVVLVAIFALRQDGDRLPVGHLEGARGRAVEGQRVRRAAPCRAAAAPPPVRAGSYTSAASRSPASPPPASRAARPATRRASDASAPASRLRAKDRDSGFSPPRSQASSSLRMLRAVWCACVVAPVIEQLHGGRSAARAAAGAATARSAWSRSRRRRRR